MAEDQLNIQFDGWTRNLVLQGDAIVLGRAKECDLTLPDASLSRRHCRIFRENERWRIEDLGSRQGTLFQDQPISGIVDLLPGQTFRIGETTLQREPRDAEAAARARERQDARQTELLRTVGELNASDQIEDLLPKIVDRAIRIAAGDRGALLLMGPDGSLEAAVARDARGAHLKHAEILPRSLPERVQHTGKPVLLTDALAPGQKEEATESVFAHRLRSVLCVPLPGPVKPIGVLYVDAEQPAENFDASDLVTLEALAVHAALALERVRVREARQQEEREVRRRLKAENAALKDERQAQLRPIGESPELQRILEVIRRVAHSDATVCLTGETGTGKEVIARYLHAQSPRAAGRFIVVDCGALPENLIESELFGHEKGSFTGATAARPGRFRQAEGGTVFLDEIGEIPIGLQSRLLRFLQDRTVQGIGAKESIPVDVRVVCATNRDLQRAVAEGTFRQDLYYRINLLSIELPPLRTRGNDILLLATHFLRRCATAYAAEVKGYTREAAEALLAHPWEGNVRELENRVHRAVLLAAPPFVTRQDLGLGNEADQLPPATEPGVPTLADGRKAANDRFESAYLRELLAHTGGNVNRAARQADVTKQFLRRLLRRHGIDRAQFTD